MTGEGGPPPRFPPAPLRRRLIGTPAGGWGSAGEPRTQCNVRGTAALLLRFVVPALGSRRGHAELAVAAAGAHSHPAAHAAAHPAVAAAGGAAAIHAVAHAAPRAHARRAEAVLEFGEEEDRARLLVGREVFPYTTPTSSRSIVWSCAR